MVSTLLAANQLDIAAADWEELPADAVSLDMFVVFISSAYCVLLNQQLERKSKYVSIENHISQHNRLTGR